MEICRLCLLKHNQPINIFSTSERSTNVADIIGKHVGEVSELDPLPKHICPECWTKIEEFHEFHQRVHASQTNYLNELVKYEEENNFIDVLEPANLNLDSPATEPIDELISLSPTQSKPTIKLEYETDNNAFPSICQYDDTDKTADLEENIGFDDFMKSSEHTEDDNDSTSSGEKFNEIPVKKNQNKKPFICDICNAVLSSKQKILEHLLRHVKYVCHICSERCPNRKSLETHNKTNHSKDTAEKSKKQLDALEQIILQIPNSSEVNRILSKHSDRSCDYCHEHLVSLQKAQNHYNQQHGTNGYLKCCDIKLDSIDNVNGHVLCHLYPEYFKCEVCGKFEKNVDKIRSHISRHLIDIEKYPHICINCNKGFASFKTLDVHYRYHHGEFNGATQQSEHTLADFFTMRCDMCHETTFSSFASAKEHYLKSHGIVGYLVCCDRKFVKAKTVDDHFQWHINPEVHKCSYCGKCFKQRMTYAAHVSKHRAKEEKKYSCASCGKAFSSNYYLKTHLKVHYKSSRKLLSCQECGKRYTSSRSLEAHILFIHSKDGESKGVVCEFCGRQFISRASVINHVHTMHRTQEDSNNRKGPIERSLCSICNASFINKYRLKKHIDTIHLGKPVKCDLCDKVAPNQSALACHMRSVHVAQSFQCHLCPKTFKAAVALKDHIATHTGEKLYKCSFCPESFIWRPNMYSHQKKAHPNEWRHKKDEGKKTSRKRANN